MDKSKTSIRVFAVRPNMDTGELKRPGSRREIRPKNSHEMSEESNEDTDLEELRLTSISGLPSVAEIPSTGKHRHKEQTFVSNFLQNESDSTQCKQAAIKSATRDNIFSPRTPLRGIGELRSDMVVVEEIDQTHYEKEDRFHLPSVTGQIAMAPANVGASLYTVGFDNSKKRSRLASHAVSR